MYNMLDKTVVADMFLQVFILLFSLEFTLKKIQIKRLNEKWET